MTLRPVFGWHGDCKSPTFVARDSGSPNWSAQGNDPPEGAGRPSSVRPQSSRSRRSSGSRPRARLARILLADPDEKSREQLRPRLESLASEVVVATTGTALEETLLGQGTFHVVIASARLPEPSALQVLARVRRHGLRTPFIVVTSVHGNMMRIFVSDAEGTVLSSRMVDDGNLASLVASLIGDAQGG